MASIMRVFDVGLQIVSVCDRIENDHRQRRSGTYSKICDIAGIAAQSIGYLAEAFGMSNANLKSFKNCEVLVRFVSFPVKNLEKHRRGAPDNFGNAAELKSFILNIVLGALQCARAWGERDIYDHKAYLDLSPEAREGMTRPLFEEQSNGLNVHRVYVGEEPLNPEMMKNELDVMESHFPYLQGAAVASQYVANCGLQNQGSVSALRRQFNAERDRLNQIIDSLSSLNLVELNEIPDFLEDDSVLSRYVCPITNGLIRDPVGDPTTQNQNGITLYERTAIVEWLQKSAKSPATSRTLTVAILVEQPALKALIDHRLNFWSQQLRAHAATLLQVPANQQRQQAADQENPRY